MNHKIFKNKTETAKSLAEELAKLINGIEKDKITIAISGGTTPFVMFDIWAKEYKEKIPWSKLYFFWVDERCLEPTSEESNYRNTKHSLFDHIEIPVSNIYRVIGEDDPKKEELRYAGIIGEMVDVKNELPCFDIILLGMGDDGHTASIFPPQIDLINSEKVVSVAQNPYSGQTRITLTGKVINNAANIYFLVTGANKAEKLDEIFNKKGGYLKYPAAFIQPGSGNIVWYFDEDAAELI